MRTPAALEESDGRHSPEPVDPRELEAGAVVVAEEDDARTLALLRQEVRPGAGVWGGDTVERERERVRESVCVCMRVCVYVCVCVCLGRGIVQVDCSEGPLLRGPRPWGGGGGGGWGGGGAPRRPGREVSRGRERAQQGRGPRGAARALSPAYARPGRTCLVRQDLFAPDAASVPRPRMKGTAPTPPPHRSS
jgi:hypothetical protein